MVKLEFARAELGVWDEDFYPPKVFELDENLLLIDVIKKITKKLPHNWNYVWVLRQNHIAYGATYDEICVYYDDKHIFYANKDLTIAELCEKYSKEFYFEHYDRYYFRGNSTRTRKSFINSEEEEYSKYLMNSLKYRFLNFLNEIFYKMFVKD